MDISHFASPLANSAPATPRAAFVRGVRADSTGPIDAAAASTPIATEMHDASGMDAPAPNVANDLALPPPKAPQAPITARTQAAFASLRQSVDAVLNTLQARAPAIDWSALSPKVPTDVAPQDEEAHAHAITQAASTAVKQIVQQFGQLSGQDMFVAFMMLRREAHGYGLRVNEQLADMATAVRESMVGGQRKHDLQAAALLDRAVAQQVKLDRASLWLGGLTSLVTSSLAILMTTSGVGLALTVGAIGIGFVAGGALGGRDAPSHFSLNAAFRGASIGAIVMPAIETMCIAYGTLVRLGGPQLPAWANQWVQPMAGLVAVQTPAELAQAAQAAQGLFARAHEKFVLGIMRGLGPRTRMAILAADPVLRSVSSIYQETNLYRIAKVELQGRTAQNLGRICEQAAKQAQERWKNTTNFLSGMQESHNDATEQILRLLTMHHQTLLKTASYIR